MGDADDLVNVAFTFGGYSAAVADISDDEILEHVKARLLAKYPDVPNAELDRMIHEEFAALRDRPVRDFLEVLTTRAVKQRVKAGRKQRDVSAPDPVASD